MAKSTEPNYTEQIAALKKERDQFAEQANRQIAFFNGKIAMLEELMNPPKTEPEKTPDEN